MESDTPRSLFIQVPDINCRTDASKRTNELQKARHENLPTGAADCKNQGGSKITNKKEKQDSKEDKENSEDEEKESEVICCPVVLAEMINDGGR